MNPGGIRTLGWFKKKKKKSCKVLLSAGTVMALGWEASQDPSHLRRAFGPESPRVHGKILRINSQKSTKWAAGSVSHSLGRNKEV